MAYYRITNNTSYTKGMPVVYQILCGIEDWRTCPKCRTCGKDIRKPSGDLLVELGDDRARRWPDLMACGDYPCFVMSDRFARALHEDGARFIIGGEVRFAEPIKCGLSLADSPGYWWADGERSRAATMDFEASGFVENRFCPECGVRSDNIGLTYDRQHADPPPGYVFQYDHAIGLDLFTTDLSPTAFFCTRRVVDAVIKRRLINVALYPVEISDNGEPMKY